ncbi:MAG: AAA family ATPase [Caldilineaceae bacterium]|nr:AAA family ATPase [Caldilineaceae bacterium]
MGTAKNSETIQVLVLTDRADTVNRLQSILSTDKRFSVRFVNTAQDALKALAQDALRVIAVDDTIRDVTPLEAIRKLTLLSPLTPIVALADERAVAYVREAMLAGARAFILKPLNEADVFTTLSQLVEIESLRQDSMVNRSPGGRRNQVILFISPKGGVGCTTLAVNTAVMLRQLTNGSVALIDGHGSLGDLETVLNLNAQFTSSDLLAQGASMDLDLITGMMVVHKSGLHVLVSGRNLEETSPAGVEQFEKMLSIVAAEYDYVVIDGGAIIEEQTSVALSLADKVLLVVTPEMTALHRTSLFLRAADESSFPREKLYLVVNRDGIKGGLASDDVGNHLNMQVIAAVTEDMGLVTYSLNRGVPLVLSDPRSAVARTIEKLTKQMIPDQKQNAKQSQKGLFGKLSTMIQGSTA